jgi:ribonuclease BN (tRNA processing enzyme)
LFMKITVLGNNGPYPGPGGACSGYLLEGVGTRILIDCGSGVLSNLQKFFGIEEIDGVILSHLHDDHTSDMLVLKYAIEVGESRGLPLKTLDVWAPPEPAETFSRLASGEAFHMQPITPGLKITMGDLEIAFGRMKHPVMCYGVSVSDGKRKFVFSGDTSWDPGSAKLFSGADVLMLDAGLLSRDKTEGAAHMTAAECGLAAKQASAGRLLLTHLWPEYDVNEVEAEAKAHFKNAEAVTILQQINII